MSKSSFKKFCFFLKKFILYNNLIYIMHFVIHLYFIYMPSRHFILLDKFLIINTEKSLTIRWPIQSERKTPTVEESQRLFINNVRNCLT